MQVIFNFTDKKPSNKYVKVEFGFEPTLEKHSLVTYTESAFANS